MFYDRGKFRCTKSLDQLWNSNFVVELSNHSLGMSITKDVLKDVIRGCSISAIIGANYIWRHRVKKLDTVKPVKHQWVLSPPCMHGLNNDHVCTVGYRGTLFSQCTSDHCLSILNHVHIHSGNQNPVFLCSIFPLLF